VVALDWWQSLELRGVRIVLVPAQHWSQRNLWDTNRSLWGSFVLMTPPPAAGPRILFIGDSGYSAALYREIGGRYGPFDLALIPIGAYEPRWFMHRQHVNPQQAVRIHADVRSKFSVGTHWGTFPLSDEPLDLPALALAEARDAAGIDPEVFAVLRHGERVLLRVDTQMGPEQSSCLRTAGAER
jgi:L-ascorbate metabolism protein UlaG (beta-lactamase superfamily)